jgi:hypothetical protein|tara:strand:+ start:2927 stop:3142 length:216 start_codon:yes stop_codon:yes gene_type:complete
MPKEGLFENLVVTVIASLLLVALGVIYFIAALLIIRFSSGLMGYSPDANWVVLSSAVIVVGIMVGSAIKNA